MGKRAGITTKEHLISAPLPEHAGTYTVISHEFIINKTKEVLADKGFIIERELYRCNEGGDIAQGVYHLKFNGEQDPEMSMMFAWSNSYDKSMRFKCAVGGYLNESKSVIISGKMGSWGRKHTGTADIEAAEHITSQIENAETYYKQLVEDKAAMKNIPITKTKAAELLGRIYFEHELLTSEQLSIVRMEIKKPSFDYNAPKDSLWCLYTAMVFALQKAHPRTWMDQQRMIHWFLSEQFNSIVLPVTVVAEEELEVEMVSQPPNQITIDQVIAEVEQEPAIEMIEPRTIEGHVAFNNEKGDSHITMHEIVESEVETEIEEAPWHDDAHPTEADPIQEDTWPCLSCGEDQGPTAVWHDGQLCTKCANEKL